MSIYVPYPHQTLYTYRLSADDIAKATPRLLEGLARYDAGDAPAMGTPGWDTNVVGAVGTYALDVVAGHLYEFEGVAGPGSWVRLYDADGFPIVEREGTAHIGINTVRMTFLAEETGRIYLKAGGAATPAYPNPVIKIRVDEHAHGTPGDDVYVKNVSSGGGDGYLGGAGNDSITSSLPGLDNKLSGGAGNDLISAGNVSRDRAIVDGGIGIDTLAVPGASAGVSIAPKAIGIDAANSPYPDHYALSSHPYLRFTGIEFIRFADKTVSIADLPGYTPFSMDTAASDSIRGDNNDNYLKAGLGNDVLTGFNGDDSLVAGGGDDILYGGGGIDILAGEDGFDTALYLGTFGTTGIVSTRGIYNVTNLASGEGTDTLFSVERAEFADRAVTFKYMNLTQSLYYSYFGRAADVGGMANFQQRLAELDAPETVAGLNAAYPGNAGLRTLIDSFGSSAESLALYGGANTAFVKAIYQNLFSRAPDQAGLDFWTQALDRGTLTRANASLAIMDGALSNQSPLGKQDAALIGNLVDVASNFTLAVDAAGKGGAYAGNGAVAIVRNLLDGVTNGTELFPYQAKVLAAVAALAPVPARSAAGELPDVPPTLVGVADGVMPDFA
ncbi:DUF4214 domain-containing protein [Massilia mucilaginosa]|nr:DUF4214 domain-containing protein [Massilia mucilaginosa]